MNLSGASVLLSGAAAPGVGPATWQLARCQGAEALAKSYPVPIDPSQAALWLQSELSAASSVPHPAVLRPLGLWQGPDGTAHLVLPRPAGRRWDDIIRIDQQRNSYLAARQWDDATRWVIRVVGEALQSGHQIGIAHGNLAPDSVWVHLSAAGDLDVALGDYTQLTPLLPGPRLRFCAPEQMAGGRADARTDVYRLALLIYFSLTGTTPWPEEVAATAHSARQTPIDRLNDDRGRAAWTLLQRWPDVAGGLLAALQFDPVHRPQSVAALLAALGLGPPAMAATQVGRRQKDLGYAIAAMAALLLTALVSLPAEDSRLTRLMLDRQPLLACGQQLPVLAEQVCARYGGSHPNCRAALGFLLSREECPNRVKQLRSCLNQP